jgi:threonine synthase
MSVMRYRDTRGLDDSRPAFTDVVIRGIATGGGLYVPESLPTIALEELLSLEPEPYHVRASYLYRRFGVDVGAARTSELMREAYGGSFDDPRIAVIEEVAADTHVLELWHGPTSAFKDMALQCMPVFFSEAVSMRRAAGEPALDYLVLVATSGDTGKAALEGFADREHSRIAVFYPAAGVSDLQRLQMVTQRGGNVAVFGAHGNFDECQTAVKAAFGHEAFGERLRADHGLALSSANSINWGRLLPQIVYYASAYADMVASGGVRAGEPMDVCVPTGNFGNILGAYYAKRIGVPIDRLLCASNENNVLADFIATGVYDISAREFVKTPSPSMDILISSNLERLLFELSGDGERVRSWVEALASEGRFKVDRETFGAVRETFSGDFVGNDESLATIRRVHDDTGYLLDPHTAVAWEVAERLRGDNPMLVVATAHWAKFGADVLRALRGVGYDLSLEGEAAGGVALLEEVVRLSPQQCVPAALAMLDEKDARFTETVEATRTGVEDALVGWLGHGT